MDNIPAPAPQVYPSPTPWYKRKILWIYILILILIPVSFYLYKNYFAKTPISPQPSPVAESLETKKFLPEQAMKSIYDLSKTSLTPKIMANSFDIKPAGEPQRLYASWKTEDNILVNISVKYNQQADIDEKNIQVTLPDPINNLTVATAPTIISAYLTAQPQGSWNCDTKTTICENFWIEQDIKRIVGAVSKDPNEKIGRIFFCEYYPKSPNYNSKSCNIYE